MNDSHSFPQGRSIVGYTFQALYVSHIINSTALFMGMVSDKNHITLQKNVNWKV
jgi:hypothetical protein